MTELTPGQRVHLIGVGGSGMSAIARILIQQGYIVSGCDARESDFTEALREEGVKIHIGHNTKHVAGIDALVISSAIMDGAGADEVAAARAQGVPIYKRVDMIASLMRDRRVIAVAGTHGKTTTTSMIVHMLHETGQQPSFIIGGVHGNIGTNARMGDGRHFVIEADEYDNMFHGLQPDVIVLTNVEYDHPDFFKSPDAFFDSFRTFLNQLADDGTLIYCADDPGAAQLAAELRDTSRDVVPYSLQDTGAAIYAANVRDEATATVCDVHGIGDAPVVLRVSVPGRHNLSNALAALAVAHSEGVVAADAVAALETFESAARRFDVRGEIDDVYVVDDYAHHPAEIRVTLDAARRRFPGHAIWAVWEPHTYTRTLRFLDEFASSFDLADHVMITPVYRARKEEVPDDFDNQSIVNRMQHPDAVATASSAETVRRLLAVRGPAVVIVMSAGNGPQISADLLVELAQR